MKTNLDNLRRQIEPKYIQYKSLRSSIKKGKKELEKVKEEILDHSEAQVTAQLLSTVLQNKVHRRIAGVVTKCLQSVFPKPYAFDIQFKSKRGKTEAHLLFKRNGESVDPTTGAGGGAVDVASFALRCAAMLLSRPSCRKIVILDEPFKFVSERHREAVRNMLLDLSKELDIQVIQVTHIPELMVGKKINIT
jgi:DNA repair exonuclease SbcCD ATPase subunit